MHLVMYEFVSIVNVVLKLQIKWHEGSDFIEIMARFKELCGLSLIHSAIDATLIHLQKPRANFLLKMIIIHSNFKVTTFKCK
jgi:hypothetical protein